MCLLLNAYPFYIQWLTQTLNASHCISDRLIYTLPVSHYISLFNIMLDFSITWLYDLCELFLNCVVV